MKKRIEYVGRKFGKLRVVSETEKKNSKRMFTCECECGKKVVVRGTHLTTGSVKSCGCSSRSDISNKRYGRLVAVKFSKVERGRTYWECKCDCGNTCFVELSKLTSGHTKSCGCLKNETIRRQRKYNEFKIIDNYVKVKLDDSNYMLCDFEDWEKVKDRGWYVNALGYAASGKASGDILLFHKFVTNTTSEIVDHINRNKLDNRKKNLRICDKRLNSINRDLQCNNTTGYKGVYLDKRNNTWNARVTVKGETIHLGTYKTMQEAIKARKAGEEKYYKPLLKRKDE